MYDKLIPKRLTPLLGCEAHGKLSAKKY